jgi:hypothetical protein
MIRGRHGGLASAIKNYRSATPDGQPPLRSGDLRAWDDDAWLISIRERQRRRGDSYSDRVSDRAGFRMA